MAKKTKDDQQPDEKDLLTQKVDEMMSLKGPASIAEAEEVAKKDDKKLEETDSGVAAVAASVNEELSASLGEPLSLNEPAAPQVMPTTAPELPGTKAKKLASPLDQVEPVEQAESKPEPEPELGTEAEQVEATELKANEYDDSETNQAVDEIAAQESDLVLAVEDIQRERKNPPEEPQKSSGWIWVIIVVLIISAVIGIFAYSGYGLKSLGL